MSKITRHNLTQASCVWFCPVLQRITIKSNTVLLERNLPDWFPSFQAIDQMDQKEREEAVGRKKKRILGRRAETKM